MKSHDSRPDHNFDDFEDLVNDSYEFKSLIKESLLILCYEPAMGKYVKCQSPLAFSIAIFYLLLWLPAIVILLFHRH